MLPKHSYLPTKLYGVGSPKAVILTMQSAQKFMHKEYTQAWDLAAYKAVPYFKNRVHYFRTTPAPYRSGARYSQCGSL
jgi:hypothetical protein